MDTIVYIRIIWRWLWLIIITSALLGGMGFMFARSRTPQFQATATIQIGLLQDAQNPATDQILTSQQLADTYAVIVKTYPVLEATVNELDLDMSPSTLGQHFEVSIIPKTSLLKITVTHPEAETAAEIANQLAEELVANSPISSMTEQARQESYLIEEIDATRLQLAQARSELEALEEESADSGTTTSRQSRHDSLIGQINAAQSNLAQLTNTLSYLQKEGRSNTLQVVEHARVPGSASRLSPVLVAVIGAVVGGILSGGGILLKELLSDTLLNPSDLNVQFGLNIIGSIAPFGSISPFNRVAKYKDRLIVWQKPSSAVAESYRALKVNLTYIDKPVVSHPIVYVITSTRPGEGKSITSANLAITYAMSGMRVLLVDADLHRPVQHKLFELENTIGLSDIASFSNREKNASLKLKTSEQPSVDNHQEAPPLEKAASTQTPTIITKTEIPGLDLIMAGSLSPVPPGLLASVHMQDPIYKIATRTNYDVIIFDTPPLLSVSDSSVIARITHGSVLMVVDPKRAKRGSVIRSVQQLASLSIPLVGVVLNRLHPRKLDASYGAYTQGRYENVPVAAVTGVYDQPPETASSAQN